MQAQEFPPLGERVVVRRFCSQAAAAASQTRRGVESPPPPPDFLSLDTESEGRRYAKPPNHGFSHTL